MKNCFKVLFGFAMLFSVLLTASAGGAQESKEDTGGLEPVTMRFYFPGNKPAAADQVFEALAEKYRDELNVDYEVNWIPFGDYKDKMMVMAASGDDWDMNYDGPWLAYTQMQNKGAYMDIAELLPKYAPDLYKKYQEIGNLAPATMGDKIVALPWTLSGNLRPWFQWREDKAKDAGLNIDTHSIKTIEDVEKVLYQLKDAYPNNIILSIGKTLLGDVMKMSLLRDGYMATEFHNLYVHVDDPTYTLIPIEETEMFREMAKLTRKWVEDGIITSDEMVDKAYATDNWNNGNLLARITKREFAFVPHSFVDQSWTQNHSELYPEAKSFNRTPLGNCMVVNKNAPNPERALMWMNKLETDRDFYDMVFYGIKGVTYELDGEEAVYPEGMDSTNGNYMNWPGQWTLWKPQFMRPDAKYFKGFWAEEAAYAKEDKNMNNPIDGLFFETASIKNEIARRDQLFEEFGRPLIFGIVPEEDIDSAIDDYIARNRDAGLDKILAECQKQISNFVK